MRGRKKPDASESLCLNALLAGRTTKLSKAMQHVDEETRAIVRNARLDALEADNFGIDAAENGDGANNASDDMYVDEDDATGGGGVATAVKDKKARKSRKPALKAYVWLFSCLSVTLLG